MSVSLSFTKNKIAYHGTHGLCHLVAKGSFRIHLGKTIMAMQDKNGLPAIHSLGNLEIL
jgi:hypothetical protein